MEQPASHFKQCRSAIAQNGQSIEAFIKTVLANIKTVNAELGLFEYIDEATVLSDAARLDALPQEQRAALPLAGLPFAVKDIIDVADMPTAFGCAAPIGYSAQTDASIVKQLKAQGALVIGKTVTTELAFLEPSRTRNPRGLDFTPGGSSSGSAAVVAANLLPLAIGTQTGGSVIRPAAFCGVFAIKPSFGLIDRFGVLSQSPSLDTIGFMANALEDLAQVIQFCTPSAAPRPAKKPFSIALIEGNFIEQAAPYMKTLSGDISAACAPHITNVTLDDILARCAVLRGKINDYELHHQFKNLVQNHPQRLSSHILNAHKAGAAISTSSYFDALNETTALRLACSALLDEYDCLLMPSTLGEAPKGLASTGNSLFNGPWTLLGLPVVHLPVAKGPNSMPIGVQVIGALHRDQELLQQAQKIWNLLSA